MKLSKLASAMPFAHLLGIAAAKAEDDEEKKDKDTAKRAEKDEDGDKQRADESDDDYAKRMEEKEDKDTAKKAEDDKDGEDKDTAKKAKKAEDDGDEDGEQAKAERGRCARIIAHGIANGCVRQAGVFAFDTGMSSVQAIKALEASAADGPKRASGLRDRMATVKVSNVGTDAGASARDPNDPKAMADAIILAGKKRRGEA